MERKPATLSGSRSPEGGGGDNALGNSAEISNNDAQSIELPVEINCGIISKDSGVVCGGVRNAGEEAGADEGDRGEESRCTTTATAERQQP